MNRTPRMALLWIVGLWSAGGGLAQDTSSDPAVNPKEDSRAAPVTWAGGHEDPWSSPDVAAPHLDDDLVKRPRASSARPDGNKPTGRFSAWVRTAASLAGVVALIILLAWGYRLGTRASSRLSTALRSRSAGPIQVISRTNLTPRQSLCLVRVGPQLVLVGATTDALRTLTVIEDADLAARLAGQEARQDRDSHSAEFQRCLETEARTYAADDGPHPGAAPDVRPLAEAREALSQAVRRLRAVVGYG